MFGVIMPPQPRAAPPRAAARLFPAPPPPSAGFAPPDMFYPYFRSPLEHLRPLQAQPRPAPTARPAPSRRSEDDIRHAADAVYHFSAVQDILDRPMRDARDP